VKKTSRSKAAFSGLWKPGDRISAYQRDEDYNKVLQGVIGLI
jgi:hypothetical protein